ncbi:PGF-CTERM-anchored ABC transporter substrate-binding protein [Haloprofundus halobius]|uniref:PGF-CTERM-anchored ABC transporter substrate-binding protein n=1 Tax=Haloprofundus halobius TaxID=2876194 RepID=UPI001CCD0142|nr:PGF-CTERM-anchored ABC transporter substrate-binding protein [Haloprofundus halobius]
MQSTRRTLLTVALALALALTPAVGAVGSVAAEDSAGATTVEAMQTSGDCSFPLTERDATGTEVTLDEEPQRVVTLNPSAAQTMWEIGAREKVVGLTKYASNLDGAEAATNVSTTEDIVDAETVVSLEPDLVLAPNATSAETVEKLREAGVTVYHFEEAETVEDVSEKTRLTGRLVGACDDAETRAAAFDENVSTVRDAVEDRDRPDVIYTFYGYTAGEGTFIDTIIETAGGDNVAAEANVTGYKRVSDELVVDADPDWVLRNSDDPTVPRTEAYNSTTAVRNDQVVVVPIEHLNRPAPRIERAITQLASAFHPDAYERAVESSTAEGEELSANGTTEGNGTNETTSTASDDTAESETTGATDADGESQSGAEAPGFGVGAAASALAFVSLAFAARGRR